MCGGGSGVCGGVCVCFSYFSFDSIYFHLFIFFLEIYFIFGTLGHHDFLSFEYLIFSSRLCVIYAFKATVSFC